MNSTLDLAYLFEHAPCGLVTTQTDGTILRANATFCGWLGYSLDAVSYTHLTLPTTPYV